MANQHPIEPPAPGRGTLAGVTGGRELSWDGCVNVRDLGGLGRIAPGAVVRMEEPTRLSEAGWAAAWAYGVRTFVDLRHADECAQQRAPRPAGMTMVRVPLDPVGTPFYQRWSKKERLAAHGTTIEASLTATVASLAMPDFLLANGLSDSELAALRARLSGRTLDQR